MRPHYFKQMLFAFILACPLFSLNAQTNSFEKIDAHAAQLDVEFSNIENLARAITEPCTSDLEKFRAIYMWIAHHVRYDCRKFHHPDRPSFRAPSQAALEAKMAAYQAKQVAKTAKYKKGVCQDYSELFTALCDAEGLTSQVIEGNARDFHKPYRNAHNNPHAWNAIEIEGQWYLLDVTWGAGYTDPEVRKFTQKVGPGFFMTPPDRFAQNHFPDDPKWQLLDQPFSKKSFSAQPMLNYGQDKYPILDFSKDISTVDGAFNRVIKFKLGEQPKYFALTTQTGRPIKFKQEQKDGYEVFYFPSKNIRNLVVYCGESQKRMDWLAKYEL